MGSLLGVFIVRCLFAVPAGWLFAYVEGRVNQAPRRTLSAILFSVFLGPIGWIIVGMRSGLTYAGTQRKNQEVTAQAARLVIQQQQDRDRQQGQQS
jgi:apolipoprotein N-acyltransferase